MSSTVSLSTVGSTVYDGAANVGRGFATVYLALGLLFAMSLCVGGGFSIFSYDSDEWTSTTGKITSADCTKRVKDDKTTYSCVLKVTYTVADKTYEDKTVSTSGSSVYSAGSSVDLQYKTADPETVRVKQASMLTIGGIVCCVAVVIAVVAFANYWLSKKSKVYAAATGVSNLVDVLT